MAVNGINSYSMYQIQSTMNMLRRYSADKGQNQAVSPVKPVRPVDSSSGAYTDVQNFLKNYQSQLTGLENAASRLSDSSRRNVFNDFKAASSNEQAVRAKGNYGLKGDTDLTVNVQSLAQPQQNTSVAHYSEETVEPGADMDFQVTGRAGSTRVLVSGADEKGMPKTYRQMYQEAAGAINSRPELGVRAAVANTEGKVSLVLTSGETGAENGFAVTGSTGAAGGVKAASTAAQNASYTVTENGFTQSYESASNKISLDYGRIDAELKGAGQSRVHTGIDVDSLASAVDDLVKGYNSVTRLLKDNADRGSGTAARLSSFRRGMADDKTLKALGITHDRDGSLQLDREKLKSALEADFEGTRSLIGGQFGIAQRVSSRAESALSDPVQRVVNRDLESAMKSKEEPSSADFRYISNFARSGPYSMSNFYTVGLLLNTMA